MVGFFYHQDSVMISRVTIPCAGYGDSGQSNALVVEDEGGDAACSGLESLVTEFNSGR